MGMPDKICGHGLMVGKEVHANQKTPMGKMMAPYIMGYSLSSGLGNDNPLVRRSKTETLENHLREKAVFLVIGRDAGVRDVSNKG